MSLLEQVGELRGVRWLEFPCPVAEILRGPRTRDHPHGQTRYGPSLAQRDNQEGFTRSSVGERGFERFECLGPFDKRRKLDLDA